MSIKSRRAETPEQFVYLYRDKNGIPLYIGRGKSTARSLSHTGPHAHNDQLTETLRNLKDFSIEIAGPFGDEETAALVEGALISAFQRTPCVKIRNEINGPSIANFRPIGVPQEFSSRASEAPLGADDLRRVSGGKTALVVIVKDKAFADGRVGVDLANPPTDAEIQERIDRWWQLRGKMEQWQGNSALAPSALIAVSGTPKHRIVVGSLEIDRRATFPWETKKGGLCRVPVVDHSKLDFGGIRGRRVSSGVLQFGGVRSQFFNIV
ncbi:hypothetical protein QM467_15775 [Rhodoblastus sp. 17X3]|uniref:hypothetical protein n=1 Tax=Rhodoblastus sp. 17X3 TaxID=3047026 RepID=UPI0024B7E90B|nr:hypothetical protein [Rhodoblastus sp. 17X3]MDI9849515.1 hypothetical protein [Rhodoblastus sp. 17X3]